MTEAQKEPICPRCGHFIPNDENPGGHPGALSRTDNATEVCSECGATEAMELFLHVMLHEGEGIMPQSKWFVPNGWQS